MMFSTKVFDGLLGDVSDSLRTHLLIDRILPYVLKKAEWRSVQEILQYLIEESYELYPFPVRALISKESYVKVINESQETLINMIHNLVAGPSEGPQLPKGRFPEEYNKDK